MKTIINAVNEFGAVIPLFLPLDSSWTYYSEKGKDNTGFSFNNDFVCTFDQFIKCVEEMTDGTLWASEESKNIIDFSNEGKVYIVSKTRASEDSVPHIGLGLWLNPESDIKQAPVFTQELSDAGVLPSAGMECMILDEVFDKHTYLKGVISFVGTQFIVWSNNGREYCQTKAHLKFKPLPTPIELEDGAAYQFDFNDHIGEVGLYVKGECEFYSVGVNYSVEICTNIVKLVPYKDNKHDRD